MAERVPNANGIAGSPEVLIGVLVCAHSLLQFLEPGSHVRVAWEIADGRVDSGPGVGTGGLVPIGLRKVLV